MKRFLRSLKEMRDNTGIKLEAGEMVHLAITRSKVGVILIWGGTLLVTILLCLGLVIVPARLRMLGQNMLFQLNTDALIYIYLIFFILIAVVLLLGAVATFTYNGNRLYVTNKRVIHYEVTSLFAHSTNIISIWEIEDVSFKQSGIFDYIFQMGTVRMSTVGDETTYTFKYVDTPQDEMAIITHLLHVAKEERHLRK